MISRLSTCFGHHYAHRQENKNVLRLRVVFSCDTGKRIVRCNIVADFSCNHSRVLCVNVRMDCGIDGVETSNMKYSSSCSLQGRTVR